jgi:hypothetical protein
MPPPPAAPPADIPAPAASVPPQLALAATANASHDQRHKIEGIDGTDGALLDMGDLIPFLQPINR